MLHASITNIDPFWWKSKSDLPLGGTIFSLVSYLDDTQKHIASANLRNLRLYGNLDILGLTLFGYTRGDFNLESRLRYNLIASVADTLANKISKNKPKPTFLTSGGDWSQQRKAKLLDKFSQGIFYHDRAYEKGQEVFLDACVWGTGILKVYEKDGMPYAERVLCDEIKVDNADAFYGSPRSMYQTKFYNREVLLEMFPDKEREIVAANYEQNTKVSLHNLQLTDQIKVIEAWHLPSSAGASDGRHVIVIENATLYDEKWEKNHFPFVFLKLLPRRIGFWGLGVSESLTPLQIEINKLLKTLQISIHLVSIPRVLLESGSGIVENHVSNEIGAILKYSGTKPEWWNTIGGVPPELINQINWAIQRGYEQFGISQLSASSQKPSGLDAAVAIREMNDIETERFVLIGQRYEQFYMDLAARYIEIAKEIADRDGNLAVKVASGNSLEEIKWKTINLDAQDYQIRIFPTSSLPTRPEARLQTVTELVQAGMIPPEDAIDLLQFPDLESYQDRKNAHVENIKKIVEYMIERSIYQPPEPYQRDLASAIGMVQDYYIKFRMQNVPDEKLELLRRWMSEADALLSKMQAPPVDQIPIDGGQPLALPEPPPTSPLIPNIPMQ